ncbi:hypothetical protein DFR50_101140 [Roseiarcus fermentans]|uniref:Strictosidine synthase n=1 Tax=Roseiarcus fermentans TaxID=1473586 RepID=A0A366FVL9_9HYPH|nr:hypothetical protein [Roseiarcus fermentans]RBP18196.1 hypothetical protein DFR50_101140 [Roseiarcus fermentans]
MFAMLRAAGRALIGRDTFVSVPPMDGPFKPNALLEQAERLFILPDVDSVVTAGGAAYCSAGRCLHRIEHRGGAFVAVEARRFGSRVAFLAGAPNGRLIVGVESEGLHVRTADSAWSFVPVPTPLSSCMTAGAALDDERVLVCVGSTRNRAVDWKRDLMENGASGAVVVVELGKGAVRTIAADLAFPYGALVQRNGTVLVSESWRHRILRLRISTDRAPETLLDDLPAYPARMAAASDGGFWLALFAPRRQLFEFLLVEHDFRRDMIATIDEDDWIGPDYRSSDAPDQPLQQGSVRQMGIVKPWAPSRSYGLVARCDADGAPIGSLHSRADGSLHGVASIAEWNQDLLIASRGAGVVARVASFEAAHD